MEIGARAREEEREKRGWESGRDRGKGEEGKG